VYRSWRDLQLVHRPGCILSVRIRGALSNCKGKETTLKKTILILFSIDRPRCHWIHALNIMERFMHQKFSGRGTY